MEIGERQPAPGLILSDIRDRTGIERSTPDQPALGEPQNYRAWLVPAGEMADGQSRNEIVMTKRESVPRLYLAARSSGRYW